MTKRARFKKVTAVASHFRLLDLPFDLREYITQFIDRRTAARLLTVSSGFHELFARSVWRCINQRVFSSSASKTIRTSAFFRYGRLVRRVYLYGIFDWLDCSIDLSQLLPNVTVYNLDVGNYSAVSKEQALHLIKAVSGFHGLRSLEVALGMNYNKVCLAPLADALISRQQNQNWQRILRFKLVFLPHDDFSWTAMARFVVKVAPLQIDEFGINIRESTSKYLTVEQMALVGPHLTSIPSFNTLESRSFCKAHYNRIIYGPQSLSGNDEPVVFSRLTSLSVKLCCASSAVYDYAGFTPAKFPRVVSLTLYVSNCKQDTMSVDPAFIHPVLSQCWPTVLTMELYGITTSSALYTILDHNPQIFSLDVAIASSGINSDRSNHFSLVDIVKRLPLLDALYISLKKRYRFYSHSEDDTNNNEDSDLLHIKNSWLRYIQIHRVTMTSDCLEMLYMLPKLEEFIIIACDLDNPKVALEKINRIQQLNSTMESGKYGANIQYIEFEKTGFKSHHVWSVELVIAMVAAAPNIISIRFDKVTTELFSAITKRFPSIKLGRIIIGDYDSDEDDSDVSEYISDMESSDEEYGDDDSDDYESTDQITI
ncbi:hypothetical protein GQ42DRAFT_86698 [Ramicandelaber brevisporus]|nr:hypothetical protein GQ42DRAFT_86698 [Ramicandelaber brevisporus]